MIRSFRDKALRRYFETGDRRGLDADQVNKIWRILTTLDAATEIDAVNLHSFRLHPLLGDLKGYWSVWVTGNWRIIFRFEDGDAYDVEVVDYH